MYIFPRINEICRLYDTALNFIKRLRFEKCEHFQNNRDQECVCVYKYLG